jgi:glycosyltransferase involved in cell wall biosynthesis
MIINKLIAPRSEAEIKSHWKYTDKVYISVVCITFNQESYIRDAIDSFLAQETEYCFDIIIHDDVSTDSTRDILLGYKEKYPSIIKLVLQEENQFSLRKKVIPIAVGHAKGEYVALCEGDDYWLNKYKLQKQTEILLQDKYSASFSSAFTNTNKKVGYQNSNDIVIKYNTLLENSGDIIPTASIMFKRIAMDTLPPFYDELPIGDYYLQHLIANAGDIYYHAGVFSFYRVQSSGSWGMQQSIRDDKAIINDYYRYYKANDLFFDFIGQSSLKPNNLLKLNTAIELFKVRCFREMNRVLKDVSIFDFKGKRLIKIILLKSLLILYRKNN